MEGHRHRRIETLRVSEATIVGYCDFCKEKTKASSSCGACAKDLCQDHEMVVAVPKPMIPASVKSRFSASSSPYMRIPILFEFVACCPECAASTSLTDLVSVLTRNKMNVEPTKTH